MLGDPVAARRARFEQRHGCRWRSVSDVQPHPFGLFGQRHIAGNKRLEIFNNGGERTVGCRFVIRKW